MELSFRAAGPGAVFARRALAALLVLASVAAPGAVRLAHAEGQIRIAEQFGIVYLLLNVARDQHLIEQEGRKQGLDIKVDWVRLSGGSAVNDALLSGSIDIAGAGIGPLLTVWDRTYGRQDVKGVASLGDLPYQLVTTDPKIHTLADFTPNDRIAVPAVTVSVQSRLLQYAVAQRWGDAQYNRLDALTQALPHPDAAAALIANSGAISAHFSTPPFQQQELARNPKTHVVLDSYNVMGGPNSSTVLYATAKFRQENPRTYRAFLAALVDAAQLIQTKPDEAADIYIRVNGSGDERALLLQILHDPRVHFGVVPHNTLALAKFMHRVGAIRHEPASWQDYFFDDPALAGGS